jgi:hypothetical protein
MKRPCWWSLCLVLVGGPLAAAPAATASAADPLGYPASLDDESAAVSDGPQASRPAMFPEAAVPIEEVRPRAGVDPARAPPFEIADPLARLTWFHEPVGPSPCDRELVDPAWMGPGEYAYHRSAHCWCARDHTRVFRSEFLGRVWVSGELLLWATSGQSVPGLVTASPAGTPASQAGVIGQPATSTLFGGGWAPGTMQPGGRVTLGYWFDPTQHDGVEASFFELAENQRQGTFRGQGDVRLLGRPYVDALTGAEAAVLVPPPQTLPADPSLLSQTVSAAQSTTLLGVDVLVRRSIDCDLFHRRWLVGGYRYLELDDFVSVTDTAVISSATPSGLPRTTVTSRDLFDATTQFHGGEIGVVERWWHKRLSLQVLGKLALGASIFDTGISGSTVTDGVVAGNGGVLAQPTNAGSYQSALFAAMGEAGISVDYALWSQCRASVGYTFLWWSTVGRAAAQIDRRVNPTQFPPGTLTGPAQPAFTQRTSDFWAQGLNLGLEYQF